jgi:hypothetical protein
LTRRYSLAPSAENEIGPGVLAFMRSHPAQVASFVSAHFLHNWVSAQFVLFEPRRLMS